MDDLRFRRDRKMNVRVFYLGTVLAFCVGHIAQAQSDVFSDEGSSQLEVDTVFSPAVPPQPPADKPLSHKGDKPEDRV
jgi:hypothetical protein